jgi:hypothetical protein
MPFVQPKLLPVKLQNTIPVENNAGPDKVSHPRRHG